MKKIVAIFLFISLICSVSFAQNNLERFPDKESAAKAGYTMQRRDCKPGEKELKGAFGTAPNDMLVFKYVNEKEEAKKEVTPTPEPEPVVNEEPEVAEEPEIEAQDFGDTVRNMPAPTLGDETTSSFDIKTISIYIALGVLLVLALLLLFWVWRLYHMYKDKVTELENEIYRIQKNPVKVDVAPQVKSEVQRQMMSADFERTVSTLVRHTLENTDSTRHPRTTPQQEIVIDQLMQGRSVLPTQTQPAHSQYQEQLIQPDYQPIHPQPVQQPVAQPEQPEQPQPNFAAEETAE